MTSICFGIAVRIYRYRTTLSLNGLIRYLRVPNLTSMHYQWPKIKRSEVKYAIFKSSAKNTPGPDRLSFRVLREAYATVPELLDYLYPVLITNGHHPKCFKEATGVILKKPQSAKSPYRNYALSKVYRVISLLNCLAKVMEKIIARRLAVMAEFKTLLYMH
jgi:hypothetical protein